MERCGNSCCYPAREHEFHDGLAVISDCFEDLTLAGLGDEGDGGWGEVGDDRGEKDGLVTSGAGVWVAAGTEEDVDGFLPPTHGSGEQGGFVVPTTVFKGGIVPEELVDDCCVAAGCGAVEDRVAVALVVPSGFAAVFDVGSGGERGDEKVEVVILRGEDEDVVFVLGDEQRSQGKVEGAAGVLERDLTVSGEVLGNLV